MLRLSDAIPPKVHGMDGDLPAVTLLVVIKVKEKGPSNVGCVEITHSLQQLKKTKKHGLMLLQKMYHYICEENKSRKHLG